MTEAPGQAGVWLMWRMVRRGFLGGAGHEERRAVGRGEAELLVVLGTTARFHDSKHVVSYVGLAPTLHASADKYRLGKITKQGSTLLRFVLGQAATHAARLDPDLKRTYCTLGQRRGRSKAKVAVARKLLVRLFIMLRDHIEYDEFRRRGRAPAAAPG